MNASENGKQPYLVVLIATVAAVGGFLFGYDLSIISGAMLFSKPEFGLKPDRGWVCHGQRVVGLHGRSAARRHAQRSLGPQADAHLRRSAVCRGLDRIRAADTTSFEFDLFRFLGGVGVGLASVVSPMFIAEVSPPRIRGALVTVNQLAIVVGLACAVVVSYYLSFGEHWRWMLASNAVPVPIFIVGLLLVPESPRWMAQRNRQQEAMDVLTLIDGRATCRVRDARHSGVRPRKRAGGRNCCGPGCDSPC